MLAGVVFLMLSGLVFADPEYVRKKNCKDVNTTQCAVHSVIVDPCDQGPALCAVKRDKKYALTLNLTPQFSAQKLQLAIYGDVQNNDSFDSVIQSPKDGCGILTCPLETNQRRLFDVDFVIKKKYSGKFPVKVKLWNQEDETKACCFTFNVKLK